MISSTYRGHGTPTNTTRRTSSRHVMKLGRRFLAPKQSMVLTLCRTSSRPVGRLWPCFDDEVYKSHGAVWCVSTAPLMGAEMNLPKEFGLRTASRLSCRGEVLRGQHGESRRCRIEPFFGRARLTMKSIKSRVRKHGESRRCRVEPHRRAHSLYKMSRRLRCIRRCCCQTSLSRLRHGCLFSVHIETRVACRRIRLRDRLPMVADRAVRR